MKALKSLEPKPAKAFRNKYLTAIMMVAALLISSVATAQLDSAKYSPISGYGFKYKRMAFDSVLMVPRSTSPHVPWRAGAIRYNAPDSTLQLWTGNQWNSILTGIGNGVDTAYMINDTLLFIETPDQNFMLAIPGRPRVDSIYRKSGQDSIFYIKNGTEYAIKDSAGAVGNFISDLTGDVTASGPGIAAATIATNVVTNTKLAQVPALSVKGNPSNSTDDPFDITAANDGNVLRRFGTSLGFGAINLASSNAVTGVLPLGNIDTTSTNHAVTQSDLNDAIGSAVSGINQLTGDVTAGPGTGSQVATITNNAVTTSKINNAAVTIAKINATGTADNTTVLYGDGAWRAPADPTKSVITGLEGILFNKSTFSSISDFTQRGTFSTSISSGAIAFSGGTSTFDKTLDLDTTMRERYTMRLEQKVGSTINTGSDGLGIGTRSINPSVNYGVATIFVTNTTGNQGKLLLFDIQGNSVITSVGTLTFSTGDTIITELERDRLVLTARAWNKTTGSTTLSITYTYPLSESPAHILPNTGTFSVFNVGGDNLMTALLVTSKEAKNAPLLMAGDSKLWYYANGPTYAMMCDNVFRPTNIHGGPGDSFDELLSSEDDIISLSPVNVAISAGSNDIGRGYTVAQTFTKYKQYVTRLTNAGINVFHLLPLYQPSIITELDALADSIRANYPADNIIDCRTPIRQCPSCFMASDNVHLNAAAHLLIYNTIINSGKLYKYYTTQAGTGSGAGNNLQQVLTNGNTATLSMELSGYNTVDSKLKVGSLEIQPYALNNAWIGENMYWDGSSFKLRNTGYAAQLHFQNGHLFFRTSQGGSAGGTPSFNLPFLLDPVGNVGIGGMNSSSPLYSDASVYVPVTTGYLHVKNRDSTATAPNMAYIDPITKALMIAAVPSGSSYTFSNGLTESSGAVKLGGTLTQHTTVDGGSSYTMTVTGSRTSANSTLLAENSSSGRGITGSSSSGVGAYGSSTSGTGITGQSSSSSGVFGLSSSGVGVQAQSTTGQAFTAISPNSNGAASITANPSSTNTTHTILKLTRLSTSAGANNIAGSIDIDINNSTGAGSVVTAHQIVSKLTTATAGSEVAQLDIYGYNSGVNYRRFSILGTGQMEWPYYGSGTYTGTQTYYLATTSSGQVIEQAASTIPLISTGTAAPATTPGKVGDIYVDTTNKKLYFATGTSSSSDWTIAN